MSAHLNHPHIVPVLSAGSDAEIHYRNSYYAYNGSRWYSSPRESGNFTMIEDRSVPTELSRVPREHWRNYPAGWGSQNDNNGNGQGEGNSRGRGTATTDSLDHQSS